MDLHGSDWVVGSDRSDSFRSNGVDRTTNATNGCQAFDRLAINTGLFGIFPRVSDFAIQTILVYNVKLSDANVLRVEAWLNSFQPAFTPANLQASTLHKTAGCIFIQIPACHTHSFVKISQVLQSSPCSYSNELLNTWFIPTPPPLITY